MKSWLKRCDQVALGFRLFGISKRRFCFAASNLSTFRMPCRYVAGITRLRRDCARSHVLASAMVPASGSSTVVDGSCMCASKSDRCDFLSLLLVMEICCQLAQQAQRTRTGKVSVLEMLCNRAQDRRGVIRVSDVSCSSVSNAQA